ncbi:MAG: hypothetical protein IPO61_17855 [Gammaproteobacteria bacterium]|nr:hypothetical protein [Gammaproteobacteria bacterium]
MPRPRVNHTRYHGVLAPNHRWRAEVTPSGRGRKTGRGIAKPERSAIEPHAAMTWARRLRRVCMRHIRVPHPSGRPGGRGKSAFLSICRHRCGELPGWLWLARGDATDPH